MAEKRDLDDTDVEIVRLLAEDARRPYSDIAEHVGLSAPAVSDRVDRLVDQGVIREFTVDVDRTKLQRRTPLLLEVEARPARMDEIFESVRDLEGIEHVFTTYDGRILAHGSAPDENIREWVHAGVDLEGISAFDVTLLDRFERRLDLEGTTFAITCAVCDNAVGSDGITAEYDGELVSFCCPSCQGRYEDRLETYQSG